MLALLARYPRTLLWGLLIGGLVWSVGHVR